MAATTPPHPSGADHGAILASDAERDATIGRLHSAAAEGRLELEEMGQRVDVALQARTRGELAQLAADLPAAPDAGPERPRAGRATRWLVGILGGTDRRGRWSVGANCRIVNVMGGCDLDLRDATLEAGTTTITIVSLMGGSDITIPEGVHVELGGYALLGGDDLHGGQVRPRPGAPTVVVRSWSIMGGNDIRVVPHRAD